MTKPRKPPTRPQRSELLEELEALGKLIDGIGNEPRGTPAQHRPMDTESSWAETTPKEAEGNELDDGIPVLDDVVGDPLMDDNGGTRAEHGETVLDDPAIIMQPGAGEGESQDPPAHLVLQLTQAAAELIEQRGGTADTDLVETLHERLQDIVTQWLSRG